MNKEVESYFSAVPEHRKCKIKTLHELVLNLFPGVTVDLLYKMPTYRFEDGWVAIGNQKNYISLYTCGYHHIEQFKDKHPDIKTGKGCINFRDGDELPIQDIRAVIEHAIRHPKISAP